MPGLLLLQESYLIEFMWRTSVYGDPFNKIIEGSAYNTDSNVVIKTVIFIATCLKQFLN